MKLCPINSRQQFFLLLLTSPDCLNLTIHIHKRCLVKHTVCLSASPSPSLSLSLSLTHSVYLHIAGTNYFSKGISLVKRAKST